LLVVFSLAIITPLCDSGFSENSAPKALARSGSDLEAISYYSTIVEHGCNTCQVIPKVFYLTPP